MTTVTADLTDFDDAANVATITVTGRNMPEELAKLMAAHHLAMETGMSTEEVSAAYTSTLMVREPGFSIYRLAVE